MMKWRQMGSFLTHFASFFALLQFSGVERHGAVFQMFLGDISVASRSWWNSWLKCRRSFPFPRCSGLRSRTLTFQLLVVVELVAVLSGFLPRQNSTALFPWNRTVDIPTGGGLQGFPRGQSSTAFLEQLTVSPIPGGGLQNFQPVQGSAASSLVSSWTRWRRGFSHFSRDEKKVRHYLRAPGRHCLRTRAHGRRRLMTCPWCSRRRRRSRSWMRRRRMKRLLWRSSMWSVTEGGGGNSGTRRRSSSAGGLLRLMALSSATPSCGLCGTLVDVPVIMLDKFQQSWFL